MPASNNSDSPSTAETAAGCVCASCGKAYPSLYWFKRERDTGAELCIECVKSAAGTMGQENRWEDIYPHANGKQPDNKGCLISTLLGVLSTLSLTALLQVTVPWLTYQIGSLNTLVVTVKLKKIRGKTEPRAMDEIEFTLTDFGVSENLVNSLPLNKQRGARIVAAKAQPARGSKVRMFAWTAVLKKPIPFWKCKTLRFKLWGKLSKRANPAVAVDVFYLMSENGNIERADMINLHKGSWQPLSEYERGDFFVLELPAQEGLCDTFRK